MSCSRTKHSDAGEARTLGLESSTLPLSHYAPLVSGQHHDVFVCFVALRSKSTAMVMADGQFI